ncbi:hypothetical protein BH20VER2_BH20VER2_04920 [soil metagenome]|nr:hypothetical protein [Chthoniobacterales bacterium]
MITPARLLLLIAALCLCACATTGRPTENRLVGKWRYEQGEQSAEYVFSKDRTFTGHVSSGRRVVADFTGRWSLAADAILYEYVSDRKGSIPPGTRDRDRLVSVTPGFYIIEARDGSQRKYARVRE